MTVTPLDSRDDKSLYEQVADHVENWITEGTLQPGDRLPSVRKLREQLSVSISTVLEAYRVLEDRGLIAARPQSGYYVKQQSLEIPPEPSLSTSSRKACFVDTSLGFQVMSDLRDPDLVKLGAAIPAMELLPLTALNRLMGQILRQQSLLAHSYDIPPGCTALRQEVAKRMLNAGCSVSPDQVVTTNGTIEALYLSLRAVTKPGDTVALESPTYYSMLETIKSLHLKALELPTHPRDGLSLPHFERILQQRKIAACMLVSNFSNPLGSCMGDRKKKELVELITQHNVPLIEDDIYGELYFDGTRPKALKAFDTEGLVLYCASVSKTLSPGLRVGWSVPGRFQAQVEQHKLVLNQTTAIAPQLTVAAFLSNGGYDRHLRQLRRAYQDQMNQTLQSICNYFPAETRVTHPNGGHVLWVEMPDNFDSMQLYQEALAQQISIAPGPMFSPSGAYQNCFRLNTGIPWSDRVDEALHTLGYLCKKQLAVNFLQASDHPPSSPSTLPTSD